MTHTPAVPPKAYAEKYTGGENRWKWSTGGKGSYAWVPKLGEETKGMCSTTFAWRQKTDGTIHVSTVADSKCLRWPDDKTALGYRFRGRLYFNGKIMPL